MVLLRKKLKLAVPPDTLPSRNRKYIIIPILSSLTIASTVLTIWSVKDLEPEDRVGPEQGLLLFMYGLVFFTASYEACNHYLMHTITGRALIKKYQLSKGFVFEISNKLVSTIQALFCLYTGLQSVCYSCQRNMLHTTHYVTEAYAYVGASYFLYDIWCMYKVQNTVEKDDREADLLYGNESNGKAEKVEVEYKVPTLMGFLHFLRTNPVIVGHHLFVGGFGFLVNVYFRGGLGDCFFGFVFLMEASTPFVSLRSIISKMGLKNSQSYMVNGVFMLVSFFVFRILMWPLVMMLYAYSTNSNFFEAIYSLPRGCKISILILILPQLYWFGLIIKGATQINKQKKKAN